ncbi:MAG: hypothetical protein ACREUF_06300 [Solimonas sp.]
MQTRSWGSAPFGAALVSAVAVGAWSSPALACSTCKCGDYTITLLGAEKAFSGRFRAAVDYIDRSESQGQPGVDQRRTDEQRMLLGFAYSFNDRFTVAAQLPLVRKKIVEANLASQEAEGLGDIDLVGRWSLYRSNGEVLRHAAGLRFGVRLPTAEEVEDRQGNTLDLDVQPDAGATAPNLGGWYAYYRFPWFLTASATYFLYGDGHQDFSPGNAATAALLGQYAVNPALALQLGLDSRYSLRNQFSGITDPDSGGFLASLSAGLAYRIGEDLLLNAGAQIPAIEDLNGEQDEDTTYRVGVTYDF